jgi:uncharacterized membrane protein HdeD (DUF308 family)
METSNYNVVRNVINHLWLILIVGILLLGMGIWIIVSPFQTFFDISIVISVGMMVSGILEMIFSVKNRKSIKGWIWMLASGIIDFYVGACLFNFSLVTMVMLPLIASIWILFRGIVATGYALYIRSFGIKSWRWLACIAITIVLLTLLILLYPIYGIKTLIAYTGIGFVLSGIFRVYLAFKLRAIK